MSSNTVPHRLVDTEGHEFRASVLFAAAVLWQPGDTVMLAPTERYRVLERRDGDPVVLVVEPAGPPTPPR
ncbi:MAG: hypothetical protein ACXVYM_05960 [Gaiellaceae bacterium]